MFRKVPDLFARRLHRQRSAHDTLFVDGWRCDVGVGHLLEMGVINPAKVTRLALENAASIASLILTTNCMIASAPSKSSAEPGALNPAGSAPMF